WDAAARRPLRQHLFPGELRECAWLENGNAAALPLQEGLTVIEATSGAMRFRIPEVPRGEAVVASPNDRLVGARLSKSPGKPGAVAKGSVLGVWEVATGKEVVRIATDSLTHFALAPDNRSLVTSDERFLRVWDLATGKERHRWPLPVAMTDSWGRTFVYRLRIS